MLWTPKLLQDCKATERWGFAHRLLRHKSDLKVPMLFRGSAHPDHQSPRSEVTEETSTMLRFPRIGDTLTLESQCQQSLASDGFPSDLLFQKHLITHVSRGLIA